MLNRHTIQRAALVLACVVALGGCTTIKGWFGADDKKAATEPAELVDITPTVKVSKMWSVDAGDGEGLTGVRQSPVVADGRVFAAAIDGGVRAFDLQSGAQQWVFEPEEIEDKPRVRLSGGPGAGGGLVAIGGLDGEVIVLDAATGTQKWKGRVGAEVIAAPVIGDGLVIVRSNDGRVTAFDAESGQRRWFWSRDLPSLTVRGNDAILLGPGFVFVGNDDGSVAALATSDGSSLCQNQRR